MTSDDDPYVTERTAALLRVAAVMLRDDMTNDPAGLTSGREPLDDLYPPIVFRHADDAWWRRMARCYDDLIATLDAGEDPAPECTGDAHTLWNAINRARQLEAHHRAGVDDEGWTIDWGPIEDLPSAEADYDWEMLRTSCSSTRISWSCGVR